MTNEWKQRLVQKGTAVHTQRAVY